MQYTQCTKKVDAYHSIMDQKSMPLLQLDSSSAECFEFVRTSFFTHKSFDHYSLTQKQQSAFSIPTFRLMVSSYLVPEGYMGIINIVDLFSFQPNLALQSFLFQLLLSEKHKVYFLGLTGLVILVFIVKSVYPILLL